VSHSARGVFVAAADDPSTVAVLTSTASDDAEHESTLTVVDTASGRTRWTAGLDESTERAAVGSGLVVTVDGHTDSSGNVYTLTAYDVRTGTRLWRHAIPVRLTSDSGVADNLTADIWGIRGGQVVTVQTGSSNVAQTPAAVAFDRTGAEKWAKPISIGNVRDQGVLSDDALVTVTRGEHTPLIAMRISDGSTLWTGPEGLSVAVEDSLVHQGKLYVPGPTLHVIDMSTGKDQTSPVRCDKIAIVKDTLVCTHGSYYGELGGSTIAYPLKPTR
jgi:hypothetical protein